MHSERLSSLVIPTPFFFTALVCEIYLKYRIAYLITLSLGNAFKHFSSREKRGFILFIKHCTPSAHIKARVTSEAICHHYLQSQNVYSYIFTFWVSLKNYLISVWPVGAWGFQPNVRYLAPGR